MALYRIKNPNIRKLALVERGANGNTWHLFKSAPAPAADMRAAELAGLVEVVKEMERQDEVERTRLAREALAKEFADREERARLALAKGDPPSVQAERQVAALLEQTERAQLRDRIAAQHAEARARPTDGPMGWLYNRPTASADEAADVVMRLRRADPTASRPRHRGGF
jgi:hypothetical protein